MCLFSAFVGTLALMPGMSIGYFAPEGGSSKEAWTLPVFKRGALVPYLSWEEFGIPPEGNYTFCISGNRTLKTTPFPRGPGSYPRAASGLSSEKHGALISFALRLSASWPNLSKPERAA